MQEVLKYLDNIELFSGISAESRSLLASVCLVRGFKKKEILFAEGEQGHAVYYLIGGDIQLYKATPEGREVVIKVARPGELFAEVILFEKDTYPVTAAALSPSTALLIPKNGLRELLNRADFRDDFIAMVMRKLRFMGDRIQQLTGAGLEERLRSFLREQYGAKEDITCSISKKDAAGALGTTPESLSRLLQKLSEGGDLTWEGDRIKTAPGYWRRK